jgi:hypothetical protein
MKEMKNPRNIKIEGHDLYRLLNDIQLQKDRPKHETWYGMEIRYDHDTDSFEVRYLDMKFKIYPEW